MPSEAPIEAKVVEVVGSRHDESAGAITRAEVDVAVETAHRWPRSLPKFHEEMQLAVSADADLCDRSYYSLMRGGKLIQGPSIRFAECVLHCWRNTMTGVRVVGETPDRRFAVVQAVGMDLERGTRYSEEVSRRITDRDGVTYNDDMIAMTIRAASAIARREIYLRLVPPSFYRRHFDAALATVVGADQDHEGRIAKLAERAKELGVTREMLLGRIKKAKLADLTERDLLHLWGVLNATDDGMLSLVDAFQDSTSGTSGRDIIDAANRSRNNDEGG